MEGHSLDWWSLSGFTIPSSRDHRLLPSSLWHRVRRRLKVKEDPAAKDRGKRRRSQAHDDDDMFSSSGFAFLCSVACLTSVIPSGGRRQKERKEREKPKKAKRKREEERKGEQMNQEMEFRWENEIVSHTVRDTHRVTPRSVMILVPVWCFFLSLNSVLPGLPAIESLITLFSRSAGKC